MENILEKIGYYSHKRIYIVILIVIILLIIFSLTGKEGDRAEVSVNEGIGLLKDDGENMMEDGESMEQVISDDGITVDNIPTQVSLFSTAKVALLTSTDVDVSNTEILNGTTLHGCDLVYYENVSFSPTQAPLTAALTTLFDGSVGPAGYPGNFIRTQTGLSFDQVIIENSVANVFLSGEQGPINGVCDEPRTKIQIEQTALQFPTVNGVAVFLNGSKI